MTTNGDKIKLNVIATAVQDNFALLLAPEDKRRAGLRSLDPEKKKAITHHLHLEVSGPMEKTDIIGSFVSEYKPFIDVPRDIGEPWDNKPRVIGASSAGREARLRIAMATVDDLRKLLQAAKKHSVEFEPAHERTAIDKATEIIQDLGLGY